MGKNDFQGGRSKQAANMLVKTCSKIKIPFGFDPELLNFVVCFLMM